MSGSVDQARFRRAARVLLAVLAAELLVLTATGVFLVFGYRPPASQAWADAGPITNVARVSLAVRDVHQIASRAMVLTAFGWFAMAVATSLERLFGDGRVRLAWAGGIATLVLVLASSFTGYLLPWDQLALWAVTVGKNYSGYRWLVGGSVRFVLLRGVEIGVPMIRRWFFVHTLVLPVLVGSIVVVMAVRRTRAGREAGPVQVGPTPSVPA